MILTMMAGLVIEIFFGTGCGMEDLFTRKSVILILQMSLPVLILGTVFPSGRSRRMAERMDRLMYDKAGKRIFPDGEE